MANYWNFQNGTAAYDVVNAMSISDSQAFCGGTTGGALYGTHAGGLDYFVTSFGVDDGKIIWETQVGTAGNEYTYGLASQGPDVFAAGYVYSDLYAPSSGRADWILSKLRSTDGSLQWGIQMGSAGDDFGMAIAAVEDSSDVYITGTTSGSLYSAYQGGGGDCFVAKVNGDTGNVIWGVQIGTSGYDSCGSLAAVPNEVGGHDVLVAGSTYGSWFSSNEGEGDCVFAKLSEIDGSVIWGQQFGTSGSDGCSVAAGEGDDNNSLYVAGSVRGDLFASQVGSADYFVSKRKVHDGSALWSVQGGTTEYDFASSVSVGGGKVVVAGKTAGDLCAGVANAGGYDYYLLSVSPADGSMLECLQNGSTEDDSVAEVVVSAAGRILVGGSTDGSLFSGNKGGTDFWMAEY